jgi:NAD(P)-dependent dehydrogenase (short-subunit alcohol dehydrogenase family)
MGTIVISGSASGIGAATAERLRGAGHGVIGVDLAGADVVADLSDPDGRRTALAGIGELAVDGLDGVVAGAGLGPQERPAGRLVAVNYFGAVTLLDGLIDLLAARGGRAVAICSNSAGITPVDDPAVLDAMAAGDEPRARALADGLHGAVVYGATKLALGRWLRRTAPAWAERGVRLNAVAPGPVDTPLLAGSRADPELGPLVDALPVPFGGVAEPATIAGVIAFLLGPESGNVCGSVLFADGGTDALLRPDHV